MGNKLTDDAVTALYRQGATQMPSPELDQAILRQAKAALKTAPAEQGTASFLKTLSRSWFTPVSAVASMVFVALLYWQNTPVFHQEPHVADEAPSQILPQINEALDEAGQIKQSKPTLETLQLEAPLRELNEPLRLKKEQAVRPVSRARALQEEKIQDIKTLELSAKDADSLAEVDTLLAENKPIQAAERLKALLKEAPYLNAHLSVQHRQLLDEEKRP